MNPLILASALTLIAFGMMYFIFRKGKESERNERLAGQAEELARKAVRAGKREAKHAKTIEKIVGNGNTIDASTARGMLQTYPSERTDGEAKAEKR